MARTGRILNVVLDGFAFNTLAGQKVEIWDNSGPSPVRIWETEFQESQESKRPLNIPQNIKDQMAGKLCYLQVV